MPKIDWSACLFRLPDWHELAGVWARQVRGAPVGGDCAHVRTLSAAAAAAAATVPVPDVARPQSQLPLSSCRRCDNAAANLHLISPPKPPRHRSRVQTNANLSPNE